MTLTIHFDNINFASQFQGRQCKHKIVNILGRLIIIVHILKFMPTSFATSTLVEDQVSLLILQHRRLRFLSVFILRIPDNIGQWAPIGEGNGHAFYHQHCHQLCRNCATKVNLVRKQNCVDHCSQSGDGVERELILFCSSFQNKNLYRYHYFQSLPRWHLT